MPKPTTSPVPARIAFTSPDEVLIRLADGERTDALHTQFSVFWPADNAPDGVRGQVFRTNLTGFIDRETSCGYTVRMIP